MSEGGLEPKRRSLAFQAKSVLACNSSERYLPLRPVTSEVCPLGVHRSEVRTVHRSRRPIAPWRPVKDAPRDADSGPIAQDRPPLVGTLSTQFIWHRKVQLPPMVCFMPSDSKLFVTSLPVFFDVDPIPGKEFTFPQLDSYLDNYAKQGWELVQMNSTLVSEFMLFTFAWRTPTS